MRSKKKKKKKKNNSGKDDFNQIILANVRPLAFWKNVFWENKVKVIDQPQHLTKNKTFFPNFDF